MKLRILLFDWTTGGHHERYIRRFAEYLSKNKEVYVAIPDEMASSVNGLSVEIIPLGKSRPKIDFQKPLPPQHRELADFEIEQFTRVLGGVKPDAAIHMYSDPIIRRLVKKKKLGTPIILCIFFPRAHYPKTFGTPLPTKERIRAWFQEYLVFQWVRREDAFALFTLDEIAVERWRRRFRGKIYWLPEPPIIPFTSKNDDDERRGLVVYGALAPRKGIDLLTNAIIAEPMPIPIILAGEIEVGFDGRLKEYIRLMEKAGAVVDLRGYRHEELEGLKVLARGRCTVLSYPQHYGMSRILLEASSVGTPVIANDKGLIGFLVKRYGIGKAVDCSNPKVFREAINYFCCDHWVLDRYRSALAEFAKRYSSGEFEKAINSPFHNTENGGA